MAKSRAIHFAKIAWFVRLIEYRPTDLVPAPVLHERQSYENPINLRVEGKKVGSAAIGTPHNLEHIDVGIGKTCVHVNHGTHRQRPREVHHPS